MPAGPQCSARTASHQLTTGDNGTQARVDSGNEIYPSGYLRLGLDEQTVADVNRPVTPRVTEARPAAWRGRKANLDSAPKRKVVPDHDSGELHGVEARPADAKDRPHRVRRRTPGRWYRCGWRSLLVCEIDLWQVAHLILGEVELDTVVDAAHRADRDGNPLLAPQVPFVE